MSSETLTPPQAPALDSPWRRLLDSFPVRYILYPVGQMVIFIAGAAGILTLLSVLLALLVPEPRPNIVLMDQIGKQLPGMIISGISIGFVYSMVALGYTLVYGVLKFINFAHSEIFMVGSVIGFEVMQRIEDVGFIQLWHPVALVVTIVGSAMIISGLLAVLIERVAYRPLRNAPRLVPLITAIGISFFLIDFVRAIEAITRNDFNLTYPTGDLSYLRTPIPMTFGETTVNVRITSIIIVLAAVIMLIILNYFVNGTKLGRGIRAVSQDRTTAGLMGINVNLMISITFFVGGALGGGGGRIVRAERRHGDALRRVHSRLESLYSGGARRYRQRDRGASWRANVGHGRVLLERRAGLFSSTRSALYRYFRLLCIDPYLDFPPKRVAW